MACASRPGPCSTALAIISRLRFGLATRREPAGCGGDKAERAGAELDGAGPPMRVVPRDDGHALRLCLCRRVSFQRRKRDRVASKLSRDVCTCRALRCPHRSLLPPALCALRLSGLGRPPPQVVELLLECVRAASRIGESLLFPKDRLQPTQLLCCQAKSRGSALRQVRVVSTAAWLRC